MRNLYFAGIVMLVLACSFVDAYIQIMAPETMYYSQNNNIYFGYTAMNGTHILGSPHTNCSLTINNQSEVVVNVNLSYDLSTHQYSYVYNTSNATITMHAATIMCVNQDEAGIEDHQFMIVSPGTQTDLYARQNQNLGQILYIGIIFFVTLLVGIYFYVQKQNDRET